MKSTSTHVTETINALNSREKTKKALDKLGPESRKRLRAVLGKFKIPEEKPEREKYLEGVAGLAQNTIGRKTNGYSDLDDCDLQETLLCGIFEKRLAIFEKALMVCSKASQVGEYSLFLGRSGFMPEAFLPSMIFFTNGREVEFKEITQRKKDIRQRIYSAMDCKNERGRRADAHSPANSQIATQFGNGNAVSGIIDMLKAHLISAKDNPEIAYEIAALLCNDFKNARRLLRKDHREEYDMLKMMSEEGQGGVLFSSHINAAARILTLRSLMRFGIYTDPENGECIPFDQYFKIDGVHGYVAKDKKDLYKRQLGGYAVGMEMLVATKQHVQHELQHIFDNATLTLKEKGTEADGEYRAYLAELAFYPEQRIARCAQLMNGDMKNMLLVSIIKDKEMEPHDAAKARIGLRMKRINPQSEANVERAAKKLLNDDYKKTAGLSYDEIIEPFGKNGKTG